MTNFDLDQRMKAYLADVAIELKELSSEERGDVLANLESHIYEALAQKTKGKPANRSDLEDVLASMDPPQAFAARNSNAAAQTLNQPIVNQQSQLAATARWAFIMTCISVGIIFLTFILTLTFKEESKTIAFASTIVLGIFVFLAFVLGVVAIFQIALSKGKLHGLAYAIIGAILPFPMVFYITLSLLATPYVSEPLSYSRQATPFSQGPGPEKIIETFETVNPAETPTTGKD